MRLCSFTIIFTLTLFFTCINAEETENDDRKIETEPNKTSNTTLVTDAAIVDKTERRQHEPQAQQSAMAHLYSVIVEPILKFFRSHKVTSVMRNIGICAVNGFMEIISFYLPTPMIPLIASAAGMLIPFEPIVMLKHKMPVTSYRRAFQTAVNGFMKTFDKYKVENDYDDDPYMTQRFNRRFMNAPNERDKFSPLDKNETENTTEETLQQTVNDDKATTKPTDIQSANCNKTSEIQIQEKTSLFTIISQFILGPLANFLKTTKLCKLFKTIWTCTIHAFTEMMKEYLHSFVNEEDSLNRRFFRNLREIEGCY